jgi:hypothetical protein
MPPIRFVPHVRTAPTAKTIRSRLTVTPVTHRNLQIMVGATDPDTPIGARDRLLLGLGWETGLMRARLAQVAIGDLNGPEAIPVSDTVLDLYHRWLTVLDGLTLRRGEPMQWERTPDGAIHPDHFLFWSLRTWGTDAATLTGKPMDGDGINDAVQRAVHAARLPNPQGYSHESLRLGGELAAERAALDAIERNVDLTGEIPDDLRIT